MLLVPLGIGVILPTFHADGKVPVEIDKLNKLQSELAILIAVHFSIFSEISSLPVDLAVSSSINISKTDSSVHKNSFGQLLGLRDECRLQLT